MISCTIDTFPTHSFTTVRAPVTSSKAFFVQKFVQDGEASSCSAKGWFVCPSPVGPATQLVFTHVSGFTYIVPGWVPPNHSVKKFSFSRNLISLEVPACGSTWSVWFLQRDAEDQRWGAQQEKKDLGAGRSCPVGIRKNAGSCLLGAGVQRGPFGVQDEHSPWVMGKLQFPSSGDEIQRILKHEMAAFLDRMYSAELL